MVATAENWTAPLRASAPESLPWKGVKLPVPEGASGGLVQSNSGVYRLPRIVRAGRRLVWGTHGRG